MNRDTGSGSPSPPCDSGQGTEILKSFYFFICKRETYLPLAQPSPDPGKKPQVSWNRS